MIKLKACELKSDFEAFILLQRGILGELIFAVKKGLRFPSCVFIVVTGLGCLCFGGIKFVKAKYMNNCTFRFGIFPSWGLSQKLSRIIGPNRAREVSLTALPLSAENAERWGLVNHLVEEHDLMNKAREVADAIVKNNQDLVLRYKSVINDGIKLDLGHALALEKVTALSLIVMFQPLLKLLLIKSQSWSKYSIEYDSSIILVIAYDSIIILVNARFNSARIIHGDMEISVTV